MNTAAIDLTSLILSALLADDAQTAQELASVLGVRAVDLRPALLDLVAAGAVVTSGRTRGMRYCLAIDEQVERTPSFVWLAEQWDANGGKVARIGGPRVRLPKVPNVPNVPATLDLMGALTEMAVRAAAGQGLAEMRAASA